MPQHKQSKHQKPPAEPFDRPWTKIVITLASQAHLVHAMPIAMSLFPYCDGLYFARYTAPTYRIEIQVCLRSSPSKGWEHNDKLYSKLARFVLGYCKHAKLTRVKVRCEPCNGSMIHAMSFAIVCLMEAQGNNQLTALADVTHWMSNMLGYSYPQEAASALRTAHMCIANTFPGVSLVVPSFVNPSLPKPLVAKSGPEPTAKNGTHAFGRKVAKAFGAKVA